VIHRITRWSRGLYEGIGTRLGSWTAYREIGPATAEDGKHADEQTERQPVALDEVQRIAHVGSWSWDTQKLQATCSPETYRIFGREPGLGPESTGQLFAYVHPDDRERLAAGYLELFGGGPSFELDYRIVREDGVPRTVHVHGHQDPRSPTRYLGTVQDVTELRQAELEARRERDELKRLASQDPLTGLANHRCLHEQLQAEVARAQRSGRSLSIAVLDLDHFKQVNDQHGHPIGDRVLRQTGERLRRLVREGELLARVGGEEFAWILPDADCLGAFAAAERARDAVGATPFPQIGTLTLSAGVCELAAAGSAQHLYRLADQALYWAKQHGRDQTACYDARKRAIAPMLAAGLMDR